MFSTLIETRRRTQRPLRGAAASVVLHTVVIVLAAVATAQAGVRPSRPEPESSVIWAPPPPAPLLTRTSAPTSGSLLALPTLTAPTIAIAIPTEVPTGIPLPGIATADPFPPTSPVGIPGSPLAPAGQPSGVWSEATVDKPVLALGDSPRPRYPDVLRGAGVEGEVVAQFVVDTLGRVEPGSVRVIRASHALFAREVERVLPLAHFLPAEALGHRVRQAVQQPFSFAIAR